MPWERYALESRKYKPQLLYKKMKHTKHKKRKPYIPDLLFRPEIGIILEALNIIWDPKDVNSKGWVVIRSPFREDKKPSFSLNILNGAFIDFADKSCKGDIIKLVMIARNINRDKAELWALHTANVYNKIYPNYA